MTINGDTEQLEIHLPSNSQTNQLILQINGNVGKIVLSGNFGGEIVFGGSGNIGDIITSNQGSGSPDIRIERENGLEVGTVDGRPPLRPVPPVYYPPPIVYDPTVTDVVYSAVYPYHAEFELAAHDAATIYFAARYAVSEEPDAGTIRDWATAGDGEGMVGQADGSEGTFAITVTRLEEREDFVLYVTAEAPNGKLSEVFKHPFTTEAVKILDASYEQQQTGSVQFTIQLNALMARPVYWMLTDDPDAEPDSYDLVLAIQNGCDSAANQYCGKSMSEFASFKAIFTLDSLPPGTCYLFATAEGKDLSPVYKLDVRIDE